MTREDWLNAMVACLRPHFAAHGATVPERLRVSIGFPSHGGLSLKRRRTGEHWGEACSADGHHEIFISPLLGQAEACSTLAHELTHACLPPGVKHKADCMAGSGYCVRVTRKWVDEAGAPICPCHHEPMVVGE